MDDINGRSSYATLKADMAQVDHQPSQVDSKAGKYGAGGISRPNFRSMLQTLKEPGFLLVIYVADRCSGVTLQASVDKQSYDGWLKRPTDWA